MAEFNTNEKAELKRIAASFEQAKVDQFLTDANVTAADTVAGLRAAVNAATPLGSGKTGIDYSGYEMRRKRVLRAIDTGVGFGILTDAAILGLTTVTGLIALTGTTSKAHSYFD